MSSSQAKITSSWISAFTCFAGSLILLLTTIALTTPLRAEDLPESITSVVIEGNETIPTSHILQKIVTQPGRPVTNRQLREDKRLLMNTRWFYSVTERFEQRGDGVALIFRVHERPIVRRVEFIGLKKVKLKEVESWTGLKVGAPFDHVANKEAERRIEQEYKEKGFFFAKVDLVKGGSPADREVVFRIHEGSKVRVQERRFLFRTKSGNIAKPQLTSFLQRQSQDGSYGLSPSAARLKTKLETKEALFGFFGGLYKPETTQQDIVALKQYYRGLGFFDIDITAAPLFSEDRTSVRVDYTVSEGVPYKINSIQVTGNHVIPTEKLRENAELREGQYFNSLPLGKDVIAMREQYGERGHYFAKVVPVPKFSEKPGVVDIVFEIDEDRPRYVRNINPHLQGEHPHTMEIVPINLLQFEPGDLADPSKISRGRSRMAGSGILENVQMEVVPVDPGEVMNASSSRNFRGQSGAGYSPSWTQLFDNVSDTVGDNASTVQPKATRPIRHGHSLFNTTPLGMTATGATSPTMPSAATANSALAEPLASTQFNTLATPPTPSIVQYAVSKPATLFGQTQESLLVSALPPVDDDVIIRGQSPGGSFYQPPPPGRGNAVLEGSPYNNQFQALPPGWVDINVSAAEGRTGRLMFGAGVNSDAGIVGSFVWDERNFNLFRPPTSFADIIDGRAWRGGGQRFRLEAAPGDQVSRYALSWTDPYFMYSDYSLSVSGFYFNRFYPDWDETRTGGRVAIGKQLTPEWSVNGAIRLEDVEIENPRAVTGGTTSVPELERVRGNNFLSTFRASATHDTRDSTLLPGEGHFMDLAYEQAFGDFNYPRLEAEGRQYFTMYNRPDGSGKHVLTLAGNLGWSGDDTPVFERYYAGGFQSFRGFAFRGITPRGADNISTGGTWQMLGTAEYRVPVTADDMIHLVAFSDFGTVEQEITADNFRVTVGLGLRVVVPAMGPVPLAFDFGFPIRSSADDDERIFSFYVGINR